MKIARFSHDGLEHIGVVVDDTVIALPGATSVLDEITSVPDGPAISLADVRLLAPIPHPPKFLAAGLNFTDHIEETGMTQPASPVFFNKQTTCVVGPGDDVHKPKASDLLDYEGELGVVIGRRCRHVPADAAFDVVAGYVIVNDVTVRDWQLAAPTMTLGKSFDTHGPIGPWIVTADEVPDPQALDLRCYVNGELRQNNNTANMIHGVAKQISYLSQAFTLEPGDLIATGTPEGVGVGMEPQSFLKSGDVIRCEVESIGMIENRVE